MGGSLKRRPSGARKMTRFLFLLLVGLSLVAVGNRSGKSSSQEKGDPVERLLLSLGRRGVNVDD
ncbi:MAG: hypothetical protein D6724_05235, partial [Armatimonadetes bacterium]